MFGYGSLKTHTNKQKEKLSNTFWLLVDDAAISKGLERVYSTGQRLPSHSNHQIHSNLLSYMRYVTFKNSNGPFSFCFLRTNPMVFKKTGKLLDICYLKVGCNIVELQEPVAWNSIQ